MLYHATFRKNLDGIKKFGLKSIPEKNWEDCEDGYVYLANDPFVAESNCETVADMLEDDALCEEDIIVFGVKKEDLDLENFELIQDPNIIFEEDEEIYSFAYSGTIPANLLYVITGTGCEINNFGKLIDLTEIPKFD